MYTNRNVSKLITSIVFLAHVIVLIGLAGCGGGSDSAGGGSSSGGSSSVRLLGHTLTGKIILPDGSSGPGILVLASRVDEGGVSSKQARVLAARPSVKTSFKQAVSMAGAESGEGSYATVTDADGVYVLTGLDTGTYYIEASRSGLKARGRGTVSPLAATVVDLALTPTGSITGYCLLSDGGTAGHSGTFIIIKGTDYIGFTDDDGGFVISQVPVGSYQVSFMHPGYESADYPESVTVPAADAAVLQSAPELEALVGGTVSGTVTGQDEQPIGGAMIRVMEDNIFAESAADGAYQLDGLKPGEVIIGFKHDLIDGGYLSDPVQVVEGGSHTVNAQLHDDRSPVWEGAAGVVYVTEIDAASYGQTTPDADTIDVAVEFGRVRDASVPLTFTVYHNTVEDWDAESWENNITAEYTDAETYDGIRGEQGVVLQGLPAPGRFVFGVRATDRHGNKEYNRSEYLFVAGDGGPAAEDRDNLLTAVGDIGIGTKDPQGILHVESTSGSAFVVAGDTGNVGIGTTDPHAALTVGSTGQTQPGSTGGTFAVDSAGNVISGAWQGDAIADDYIETVSSSKIVGDIPSTQITGGIPSSQISGAIPTSQLTGPITGASVEGNITGFAAGVTGIIPVENGGTGAATVEQARANLGITDTGSQTVSGGPGGDIDDGTITADDLADSAVSGGPGGDIDDGTITTDDIAAGTITSADIAGETITDAEISATAAIAGTKISPDFGTQKIITMGKVGISTADPKADLHVVGSVIMGPALGTTAEAGMLQFDGTAFKGYDGLEWKSLDSASVAQEDLNADDLSDNVLGDLSDVSDTTPATDQVLKWTGAAWAPVADADTTLTETEVDTIVADNGYLTSYTETDPTVDLAKLQSLVTDDFHNLGGTDLDTTLTDGDITAMGYIKTDTTLTDGDITAMGYIKTDTDTTYTAGANIILDGTTIEAAADGYSLNTADGSVTDVVYVTNDGKVGIGTSDPDNAVTLNLTANNDGFSLNNATNYNSYIRFWENGVYKACIAYGGTADMLRFSSPETGYMAFYDGSTTEVARIQDGNVGIGSTAPGYKLDVAGTINATEFYQGGQPLSSSPWNSTAGGISYSAGSVGIGVTPGGASLEVTGRVMVSTVGVTFEVDEGVKAEMTGDTIVNAVLAAGTGTGTAGSSTQGVFGKAYYNGVNTLTSFALMPVASGLFGRAATGTYQSTNGSIAANAVGVSGSATETQLGSNTGVVGTARGGTHRNIGLLSLTNLSDANIIAAYDDLTAGFSAALYANNNGTGGDDYVLYAKGGKSYLDGDVLVGGTVEAALFSGGDASFTGALTVGTTAGTTAGTIRYNGGTFEGYDGSSWKALDMQPTGSAGGWTQGTGIVTLTTSGDNVGIGTTSPGAFKLNVAGTAFFGATVEIASGMKVDGRDISVDGVKLDGITAGADVTNPTTVAEAGAVMTDAIGTDVQAYHAALQSISGLTTDVDRMLYTTTADTYAVAPLTSAGRELIDDADVAAQRITLELGSAATAEASEFMSATADNWVNTAGDTMTGTLNLPANGLAAGTNQLVLANGGVGIGTTAPATLLEVKSSQPDVGISWTDTNTYGRILFSENTTLTANVQAIGSTYGTADRRGDLELFAANDISLWPGNAQKVTITSDGSVGIGTTAPIAKLDIWGNGRFTKYSDNSWGTTLAFAKARGTQSTPTAVAANDELGYINFYGYDGSSYIRGSHIIAEVDGTPGTDDMPGRLAFYTTPDGQTEPLVRMTITNDGKVGIGSASPAATLDVAGSANMTTLSIGGTAVTATAAELNFVDGVTGAVQGQLDGKASAASPTFTGDVTLPGTGMWKSTGDVGIGTAAPAVDLHLFKSGTDNQIIKLQGDDDDANMLLSFNTPTTGWIIGQRGGTSGRLDIMTDAGWSEKVSILQSGNVGIGTIAPSYPLDVKNSADGTVPLRAEFFKTGMDNQLNTSLLFGKRTTGDMADGFGAGILFYGSDGAATDKPFGSVGAVRDGSDDDGAFVVHTTKAGSGGERFRISKDGFVGIGTSNPIDMLEIKSDSDADVIATTANANNNDWSKFASNFSRGTVASPAVVNAGDTIGEVSFCAWDGSGWFPDAARIYASIDGTPGTGDLPGKLVFATTADGENTPTDCMVIKNDGNVGIGLAAPNEILTVEGALSLDEQASAPDATAGYGKLYVKDDSLPYFLTGGGDEIPLGQISKIGIDDSGIDVMDTGTDGTINFVTENTPVMAILADGAVIIGSTTESNVNLFGSFVQNKFSADGFSSEYIQLKARGTKIAPEVVQADDELGWFGMAGHDGATFFDAAGIAAKVDGTPGTDDMPGRLEFRTTADGTNAPATRMVIKNDGKVGIGTPVPSSELEVENSSGTSTIIVDSAANFDAQLQLYEDNLAKWSISSIGSDADKLHIAGDGGSGDRFLTIQQDGTIGIGTTSPDGMLDVVGANIKNTYYGNYTNYMVQRANGTSASPTAVVDTNPLGTYRWNGYDGDSFEVAAQIQATVTGTVADGKVPGKLDFWTKRDSDGDWGTRMTISDTGNVGIGTTAPAGKLSFGTGNGYDTLFIYDGAGNGAQGLGTSSNTLNIFTDASSSAEASIAFGKYDGPEATTPVFTEWMRIKNGNVGIGSTSPSEKLDVIGNFAIDGDINLYNQSAGATGNSIISLTRPDGIASNFSMTRFGGSASGTRLGVNAANAAMIFTNIGSTDEATLFALGTSGDIPLVFSTYNIERMRITNGGNVGIGTTAPAAKLHLAGSVDGGDVSTAIHNSFYGASSVDEIAGINFDFSDSGGTRKSGGGIVAGKEGDFGTAAAEDAFIAFSTRLDGAVSEKMRITSDGSVGIGTTAPTNGLIHAKVATTIGDWGAQNYANTVLRLQDSTTNMYLDGNTIYSDGSMNIGTTANSNLELGTNNAVRMTIAGDGNFGIGTSSPHTLLHILNGSDYAHIVKMQGADATSEFLSLGVESGYAVISAGYQGTGNNALVFQTSSGVETEKMRITSAGSVGIGTDAPGSYKLHVNGSGYLADTAWTYSSDERLKENVDEITAGLDVVEGLRPVKFDYIDGEKRQAGFIAQEVRDVLPDIVTEGPDGMLGMKTDSIIPYLVKAIQEQQKEIEVLKAQLNAGQ